MALAGQAVLFFLGRLVHHRRLGRGGLQPCVLLVVVRLSCAQGVERRSRFAARLGAIGQQVLPTRVRDVEPIAVRIQITNVWVAHMDDAHPVTHICACP